MSNLYLQIVKFSWNLASEGQKIDNQTKLKFYAFFKQATIG